MNIECISIYCYVFQTSTCSILPNKTKLFLVFLSCFILTKSGTFTGCCDKFIFNHLIHNDVSQNQKVSECATSIIFLFWRKSTRVHCVMNYTKMSHHLLLWIPVRRFNGGYVLLWFPCKKMWRRSCLTFLHLFLMQYVKVCKFGQLIVTS